MRVNLMMLLLLSVRFQNVYNINMVILKLVNIVLILILLRLRQDFRCF